MKRCGNPYRYDNIYKGIRNFFLKFKRASSIDCQNTLIEKKLFKFARFLGKGRLIIRSEGISAWKCGMFTRVAALL